MPKTCDTPFRCRETPHSDVLNRNTTATAKHVPDTAAHLPNPRSSSPGVIGVPGTVRDQLTTARRTRGRLCRDYDKTAVVWETDRANGAGGTCPVAGRSGQSLGTQENQMSSNEEPMTSTEPA